MFWFNLNRPIIKKIHSHIVPKSVSNIRLQDYASVIFKDFIPSKSGIKKAIKKGEFYINNEKAETGTWVETGQEINLFQSEVKNPKVYELKLPIIFEDEHIAIINKPAGITVSGNQFKTIFNALPFNLNKSKELDALSIPTPVHRLDNQTSGILIIAKTKTAQIELGKQFDHKTIQKKYYTIAVGKISNNKTICSPIENKPSETKIDIISTHNSLKYKYLSFLSVFPKTGRTHQIRIHLASIGHPILGDKLYGNSETLLKGKGLFLCAQEVTLKHPKTFDKLKFSIDIPQKFESILVREEKRYKNDNN